VPYDQSNLISPFIKPLCIVIWIDYVIAGLHYLHSALSTPLIHRDVKARNILLTEKLEANISDLGLARATSSEGNTYTITGTLSGTPGYVDPEYASNKSSFQFCSS
jgi:serine/threonine protein kinase